MKRQRSEEELRSLVPVADLTDLPDDVAWIIWEKVIWKNKIQWKEFEVLAKTFRQLNAMIALPGHHRMWKSVWKQTFGAGQHWSDWLGKALPNWAVS
jgi:hypothetical protein